MEIAYLILVHNTPNHLKRLINALSSPSSSFFIHIDKKSNSEAFKCIRGSNVHFIPDRVPVFWGDFSIVEATLFLLRASLSYQSKFKRFVLLSGADYPLKSNVYIESFFAQNEGKEFISMTEMPCDEGGKPISRLNIYKVRPGDHSIMNKMRQVFMRVGLLSSKRDYKSYLGDIVPYGGSAWWALSRNACDYILDFVNDHPNIVTFFKNTHSPDESIFQTILANSSFSSRIVRNLTYADWSSGGASPANISSKHISSYETLLYHSDRVYGDGEMLFARKFTDDSKELVALLEEKKSSRIAGNPPRKTGQGDK